VEKSAAIDFQQSRSVSAVLVLYVLMHTSLVRSF
jgi:hypothetical protein